MPGKASAWSLFGPKTFEECLLKELPKAQTKEAAELIQFACMQKFAAKDATPTKESRALEAKKKECGLPEYSNWKWFSPPAHYATRSGLANLKNVSMNGGDISFQNNNEFAISQLKIGFTKTGSCPENPTHYEAINECFPGLYSSGVDQGRFGSLTCDVYSLPPAIRRLSYCVIAFSPFHVGGIRNVSDADAVSLLQRLGYCSR